MKWRIEQVREGFHQQASWYSEGKEVEAEKGIEGMGLREKTHFRLQGWSYISASTSTMPPAGAATSMEDSTHHFAETLLQDRKSFHEQNEETSKRARRVGKKR